MSSSYSQVADFEHMFDLAPVSLWLEDYSALKQLFDRWRSEGVTDLHAHLAADPARLNECSASLRILRVNRRTLELFAFAATQGEQDATVGTGLGGHVEVGEQGGKFFLDQAHVYQLR